VSGQSIVKLYAAAMLPGFFLTFLYLVYILGWAIINPKIAPKLPPDQFRIDVPNYLKRLEGGRSGSVVPGLLAAVVRPAFARGLQTSYGTIVKNVLAVTVPILLTFGTFAATWWYVVIYNAAPAVEASQAPARRAAPTPAAAPAAATAAAPVDEAPQELGAAETEVKESESGRPADAGLEEVGSAAVRAVATGDKVPAHFYQWFWGLVAFSGLLLLIYFWRMDGEQLQILKELIASVVPLGVLTFIVLGVILFGICTATESAAIGALGALYLAVMSKYAREVLWWSLAGAIVGFALGWYEGEPFASLLVAAAIGGTFLGTVVPGVWHLRSSQELRENLKQSTFLTAKTTAMVCWLFVGSALFSAVFALHGGQGLIERWVLSMNLSPLGFQITAQLLIFLLGWPLEWTEIIVIFCPIFIPLLTHFHVDPILFGTMVAVNLQAAFLSPPVAMSAFYLKGVSPKHVTLNQIFAGMMPYMIIVLICLAFMYIWPGMTLWLPEFLYGD
jgi:TRAP-type mannitol/chloroaromatic compound transport system permease large subunit